MYPSLVFMREPPFFSPLPSRKVYYHAFSQELKIEVKHGIVLKLHQLMTINTTGLNADTPLSFTTQVKADPKLTKLSAYYCAHVIKNAAFILD